MGTAAAQSNPDEALLSVDDLSSVVADRQGELVRGEFIEMPPTGAPHAEIEANIAFALNRFVKERGIGKVFCGEVGIITHSGPDTVRGADVAFISAERLARRRSVGGYLDIAPELIVEIVSPNDRWTDVSDKLQEYFAIGIEILWLVNPKRRQVTVHRSPTDATLLEASDSLDGGTALRGLEIRVADILGD